MVIKYEYDFTLQAFQLFYYCPKNKSNIIFSQENGYLYALNDYYRLINCFFLNGNTKLSMTALNIIFAYYNVFILLAYCCMSIYYFC